LGRRKEAIKILESSTERRKKIWGHQHPYTLSTVTWLAVAYQDMGQFKKARLLQEETVNLMERGLGTTHAHTILARSQLANTYVRRGPNIISTKAIAKRKEALENLRLVLGEKDPRTLDCKELLAEDFFISGSLEKARKLQESLLVDMFEIFGEEHEHTQRSLKFLEQIRTLIRIRRVLHWWVPAQMLK